MRRRLGAKAKPGQLTLAIAAVLAALLLAAPASLPARNGAGALAEKVKTAFLYKFSKYVQWPDAGSGEFRIAVVGDSPVTGYLQELAKERAAEDRKIKVELLHGAEEIRACHILFIAATEKTRLPEILKRAEGKNILTVADSKGLAARGVAINFVVVGGRLRFEINRRAAEGAGLQISSELLKLAILVDGEKGAEDVRP